MSTAIHDEQWFERIFAEHSKAIVRFLYRRRRRGPSRGSFRRDVEEEKRRSLWRRTALAVQNRGLDFGELVPQKEILAHGR